LGIHKARQSALIDQNVELCEICTSIYEQGASIERLWQYVSRWCDWLWGGVYGRVSRKGGIRRYWVRALTSFTISDMDARWFDFTGY